MHYAHINANSIVDQVIVADPSFIATLPNPEDWIPTSYNTRGGKHYNPTTGEEDTSPTNPAVRGNYAGIGYIYDKANDVFYPPQPFPSWTISSPNWTWTPPNPYPSDGKQYKWDEPTKTWVEITIP